MYRLRGRDYGKHGADNYCAHTGIYTTYTAHTMFRNCRISCAFENPGLICPNYNSVAARET